jgi:CRP/FNR family transcriptional regulator, nitrogen oxide reductase regulator
MHRDWIAFGTFDSVFLQGDSSMPAPGIAALPSGLKSRFLEGLATRDLEIVRAVATERRYIADSVITNQGNPADHLFLLISGRARHFVVTPDGHKTLLHWLTPGDIFGGAAFLLRPSKYLVCTEALKDSSVLVWDRATLRRLATQQPRLLENAFLVAADYLTWYIADHTALVCHNARQRLAHVLVGLSGVIGQQTSGGIEFDATNEELASAANITPFTASRLLREWQTSRAVVKRRGKIVLRSSERLFLRVVRPR